MEEKLMWVYSGRLGVEEEEHEQHTCATRFYKAGGMGSKNESPLTILLIHIAP